MEEDCPLCLEPLHPFWDVERRIPLHCCCKYICVGCVEQRNAHLHKAAAEGTPQAFKEAEQLSHCCPLCRAKKWAHDVGRMLTDKFEEGKLPLPMHCDLAIRFVNGTDGLAKNVERGIEILKLGAEKGDPVCQYVIGSRYLQGIDLPKSEIEAKRWYLRAAEQGHAIAEFNLANMMRTEGRETDCLRYLEGSASKGFNNACFNLGKAYFFGENGLQQSAEEAIRVLTPAAERGHVDSMGALATCMCCPDHQNQMAPWNPNFTRGMQWARRAAEKGDQTAISKLKEFEGVASSICFNRCNKRAPPETAFLRCSRCRAAWYCSKDCQVQHWRSEVGHKQFCIKWKGADERC